MKGLSAGKGTQQICVHLTLEANAELRRLAVGQQTLGRVISELILCERARREERAKIQAELVQADGSTHSEHI